MTRLLIWRAESCRRWWSPKHHLGDQGPVGHFGHALPPNQSTLSPWNGLSRAADFRTEAGGVTRRPGWSPPDWPSLTLKEWAGIIAQLSEGIKVTLIRDERGKAANARIGV